MFKIKTLNKISNYGLDKFNPNTFAHGEDLNNADAVMVRSASMHDMELEPDLKAIARAGAGVNNIPVDDCSKKGIVVFNTPGANANAVKELVIAGMLLCSRKIVPSMEWLKTIKGEGENVPKLVEKGKSAFAGPELKGKKLGVVGLGAIGVLVANAARHFGMDVYGYDPYMSVDSAWEISRSIKHAESLNEIYENCHYISIHAPLNDGTKHMINTEVINTMADGVRILNFSRAALVDNSDMIEALAAGKVSAYVTDFPTHDLIGVEGVVAIPHLGASTPESEDNCALMAAEQLIDFLQNGNIKNSVNLPDASMPKVGDKRLCVIHDNVPNVIAQISSALSSQNINIEHMLTKSKNEYAYSIFDVVGGSLDGIEDKIEPINGVIRLRLL